MRTRRLIFIHKCAFLYLKYHPFKISRALFVLFNTLGVWGIRLKQERLEQKYKNLFSQLSWPIYTTFHKSQIHSTGIQAGISNQARYNPSNFTSQQTGTLLSYSLTLDVSKYQLKGSFPATEKSRRVQAEVMTMVRTAPGWNRNRGPASPVPWALSLVTDLPGVLGRHLPHSGPFHPFSFLLI